MRWSSALLLLALLGALALASLSAGADASPLQRLRQTSASESASVLLLEADAELDVDAEAELQAELEAEAEAELDLDADADAELDAEVDMEADAEAETEAEMEAEAEAEAGVYALTAAQLASAAGISASLAQTYLAPINAAAAKFSINSAKRMAGFLAQVGHESGGFDNLVENLSYDAAGLRATFPSYFNANTAKAYARNAQKIANRAYANRMGNGNEASGDGWKYRGRGLIQITGKDNYQQCGAALGLNLIANPDLLTQPMNAAMSAGWYWQQRNINSAADSGNVRGMTEAINPALKGLADRQKRYAAAKKALGVK